MAYTQQDAIKAFMASLDTTNYSGTTALNAAVTAASSASSNVKFTTIQAVINKMKEDITATNDATKFLKDFCGIDLDNDDTGAITGSDAGGSTPKIAESVVPESTAFQSYDYNSIYISDYGFSIYLSEFNEDTSVIQNIINGVEYPSRNTSTLSAKEKYVWSAYCNWWAKEGIKLVQESYGTNFGFNTGTLLNTGTTLKPKIYFGFYYSDNNSTADSGPLAYNNKDTKEKTIAIAMRVNMTTFSTIDTSDPNGSNSNGDYLDMSIAHEFTHCLMAANINYYAYLPQFIKEGMAELTIGGDVSNGGLMKVLANPSALTSTSGKSLFDQAIDLNNTGTGDPLAYAGGYMFLRYLAKQLADSDSGGLNISNSTPNTVLNGGSENDSIVNNSAASNTTIYGGDGDDSITNFASTVMIMGGANNDTVYNYGNGSYTTIYGGGGKDYISNSGSNVTISGGNGDDTLDTSGIGISISGDGGNDRIYIYAYNTEKITVNGGTGNDTINNQNTSGVLYQYASGDNNDLIYGATADDTIKITGGTYKPSTVGSDLILTVGSGAVTLKGAANVALTIDGTIEPEPAPSKVVSLTSGNDTYATTVEGATVYAAGGNDFVTNSYGDVAIFGGEGDDSIINSGADSTIDAGAGTNYVQNGANFVTISTGPDNDVLRTWGNNGKISTGAGNDSISHGGSSNGTYYGNKVTINAGAGNDTIQIWAGGDSVYANAGADNDTVLIYGSHATIDTGDGDDTISSYNNSYVSIDSGAGNDKITVGGNASTVRGGAGNDFITDTNSSSVGNIFVYDTLSGNDTLSGANSYDTLKIIQGTYSLSSSIVSIFSGDNITGTIRLDNSANVKIDGTLKPEENLIENYTKNTTLNGTSGEDTISNYAGGVKIYGSGGDDYIYNSTTISLTINGDYGYVTIDGGDGNDTIINDDPNVSINGGAGADKISLGSEAYNATIDGGAGNDTIYTNGNGNIIKYAAGGKDTIYGFGDNDTIFVDGTITGYATVSGGVNVTIGSGTSNVITIKDVDLSKILVEENAITAGSLPGPVIIELTSKADNFSNSEDNVTISALAGNDTLVNRGDDVSISGGDGADSIISGYFNSSSDYGGKRVTISGGNGNDTIFNRAGGDSVKVYGDAGADSITNMGSNMTIDGGAGNDVINSYGNSYVSIDGGAGADKISVSGNKSTVRGGAGNDSIYNGNTSSDGNIFAYSSGDGSDIISGLTANDTLYISSGSISSSVVSGSDAIVSVDSGSITLKDYANKKFWLKVGTATAKQVSIGSEPNPNSLPSGWKYGTTLASNTAATIMSATLASADDLDLTDEYGEGVKNVNAAKTTGGIEIIGNDLGNSIKGGSGADSINGGDGNDTIYGGAGNDTIHGDSGTNKLYGDAGDDILYGGSGTDTLSGGAGNDTLYGTDGNDSLSGVAGNDVLIDGWGNDTLTGGAGNDTFYHIDNEGDNDVITDYVAGQDKIKLFGFTTLQSASLSGTNVVFYFDNSTLTVKNGKDKQITIIDAAGKETTQIYPTIPVPTLPSGWKYGTTSTTNTAATIMSATVASADDLDLTDEYGEGVIKVDASKTTGGVEIIGNDEGNSIKGGKGADTIYGGWGDDTVSLGAGADVYVYQGGDDLIQDYAAADTIQFASYIEFEAQETVSSNVILVTDMGDITVKGGKSKDIIVMNDEGERIYPPGPTLPSGWKYGTTLASNTTATIMSATLASADDLDLTDEYGEGVVKVDASKTTVGVEIIGNDEGNSIKGGKGADTIIGGWGNDTVSLGAGADVYVYQGGNDLIQDYAAADTIQFASYIEFEAQETVSSNVILVTDMGDITVKGGKSKDIIVMDDEGERIYPPGPTLPSGWKYGTTLASNTAATIMSATLASADDLDLTDEYGEGVKNVNAAKTTGGVEIVGNDLGNSIKGGSGADYISGGYGNDTLYGGAGNDTIWGNSDTNKIYGDAGNDYLVGGWGVDTVSGGAGNDTLYGQTGNDSLAGGAGNDVLIGGAGNDTLTGGAGNDTFYHYDNSGENDIITDYAAGQDKIQLSYATVKSYYLSGSDVVFNFNQSTLTVKNGKGKSITIVDASGKTTTQTYSGAVSGNSALFVDDNFIGGETNLDDISGVTENNYSVGKISATEIENLAQDMGLLSFGAKESSKENSR